jgi:hypothetical protein
MITGSTPTVVWSTIRARGVVGDLRRVAGGDLAVGLERGLEVGQSLQGGLGTDALVGDEGVAVDRHRDDLALEAALLGRLVSEAV